MKRLWKIALLDEKRDVVDVTIRNDEIASFDALSAVINDIHPEHEFNIYWKDQENDWIRIKKQSDFEAYLHVNLDTMMKLFLLPLIQSSKPEEPNVVHEGVVCNECGSEVKGFRYKCLQCIDYDLCEKCESNHMHSEHFVLRIPHRVCTKVYHRVWKKMHGLCKYMDRRNGRRLDHEDHSFSDEDVSDKNCDKKKHHRKCHKDQDADFRKIAYDLLYTHIPPTLNRETLSNCYCETVKHIGNAVASVLDPFAFKGMQGSHESTSSESTSRGCCHSCKPEKRQKGAASTDTSSMPGTSTAEPQKDATDLD